MFSIKESEEEEYDASEYPQRVGRQKHVLDIDIHFNDARRGGGGRGRGARSGPRGNRTNRGGGDQRGDRQTSRFRATEEQVWQKFCKGDKSHIYYSCIIYFKQICFDFDFSIVICKKSKIL